MGFGKEYLDRLDRLSKHMYYREEIDFDGPFDLEGFLKKAFTGKKYQDITPEQYLEKSSEILEGVREVGERYGRDIERIIKGHEKMLETNHRISYETAEEMAENGQQRFNINYEDKNEELAIYTWKAETIEGEDEIIAELDAEFGEVRKEEFLEYKEVLKDLGFQKN